jgi:hypothetical protein
MFHEAFLSVRWQLIPAGVTGLLAGTLLAQRIHWAVIVDSREAGKQTNPTQGS